MSMRPNDSSEDLPSVHLDPGDLVTIVPDPLNPEKQPVAAQPAQPLDSGSVIEKIFLLAATF